MVKTYAGVHYVGKSTEEMPKNAENGEHLIVVDTREEYIFYDGEWYKVKN